MKFKPLCASYPIGARALSCPPEDGWLKSYLFGRPQEAHPSPHWKIDVWPFSKIE